jgi:hypothetical protein
MGDANEAEARSPAVTTAVGQFKITPSCIRDALSA